MKHCCSSVHTLTPLNVAKPRGFTSTAHVWCEVKQELGENKRRFEWSDATLLEVLGVLFKRAWAAQQIDAVGRCASSLLRSDWTVTFCSWLATAWYIGAGLGLSLFLCTSLSLPPLSALSSSLPRLVPIESGISVWSGRISMRAGALLACARVCGTLVLENTNDWRKLEICFWFFWGDLTAVSNVYAHCSSCYFCDNGRFLTLTQVEPDLGLKC